jgi:anti-sigma factor RsiW
MKTDDVQLMAYVDGNLSPQDRQEIEAEVRGSVKTAARVALLQASRLPYSEAFAYQKLPPVPQRLIKKITELVCAALDARANALGSGSVAAQRKGTGHTRRGASRIRRGPIRLKW